MTVDCVIEDIRWNNIDRLAKAAKDVTLTHLGFDPSAYEVSILACSDERIAVLNSDFRGKPSPTNVLSWPSSERAAAEDGGAPIPPELPQDAELGDIAIAFETCIKEATAMGKFVEDHVTHLLIHGVLHLLGYDHERDKDAALMERLETQILGKLGISDPYKVA